MPQNKPAYMFGPLSYAKRENGCVFAKTKPQSILTRLYKMLRKRPICRRSFTQRLVSWSSLVVPKVWIKTQKRVEKGQKMGRAEVIQTGVADLQRYHQGRRNSCGEGGGSKRAESNGIL